MTTTVNRMTAVRRIGVLIFAGVAAALVGLGTSGNAAADMPLPEIPFMPDIPGTPPPPSAGPVLERDSLPAPPQQPQYLPPPPLPWNPPAPAGVAGFGDSVSLNPQPLPPGPERGRRVTLNPQPLPPGPDGATRVGLNPQPLPPGPDRWRDSLMLLPGF